MYTDILENDSSWNELKKLKDRFSLLSKKKSKLLEYNISGQIGDQDFIEMNKEITKESAEICTAIEEIENEINSRSEYKQKIEGIRNILLKAEKEASTNMIDKAFINRYIDKIYVTPIEENVVEIAVKIFSGDTVEKHLTSIRKRHKSIEKSDNINKNEVLDTDITAESRTGHTFKKMVEAYENGMK